MLTQQQQQQAPHQYPARPASSLSDAELQAMVRGLWFPSQPIDWYPLAHADVSPCLVCETRCKRACAHAYRRRRQLALQHIERDRQFLSPSGHLDFAYAPARHHRKVQEHLDALFRGDINRLMIFAPPGSAKSTYASIHAVTRFMAANPTKNVLCCSNTQDLAETFNRRRRTTCETEQWQELSGTSIDPNNKGVKEFGLRAGGLCTAAGQGTSITGKRSHFNVADDLIVGHEQANSPSQLDKMWNWWETEFSNRLIPFCPELVIMTRWSSGDIAGRLLDQPDAGTWTVLRLPLEADDPDDPLGRALGEPLWPEWYDPSKIESYKQNKRDWLSLWQQRPVDERGTWVPEEHIHVIQRSELPKELNKVVAVDIALSVGSGDFTVIAVIGVDAHRNLYLLDLYRDQVDTAESANKFLDMVDHHRPSRALIDDDNASKVWTNYVFNLGRQRNIAPPLQLRPMRGNDKETRAAAFRGYALSDQFYIVEAPWTATAVHEVLSFPSAAATDDIIDTLGLVGREMAGTSPPVVNTPLKELDLGEPIVMKDGVQHLNMTLDTIFEQHDKDEVLSIGQIYRNGW